MSLSRAALAVPVLAALVAFATSAHSTRRAPGQISDPPYCWHDYWENTSKWHCGDTVSRSDIVVGFNDGPVARVWGPSDANPVAAQPGVPDSLLIKTSNRGVLRFALPRDYDGVVFSRFAVDTFIAVSHRDSGEVALADSISELARRNWGNEDRFWLGCYHLSVRPYWQCSSTRWINPRNVLAINIVRHAGDSTYHMRPGKGADAVFVTKHACKKMLAQYYDKKLRNLLAAIERQPWASAGR